MESAARTADEELIQQFASFDRFCNGTSFDQDALVRLSRFPPAWTSVTSLTSFPALEPHLALRSSNDSCLDLEDHNEVSSMSLAEFVRWRFIPEFVEIKKSAGRAHFREILKYILLSEKAPDTSSGNSERASAKRKAIQSWPYMDCMRLCDITEDRVHLIASTALNSGYSLQTATHIRNVIRAIYSYAISACSYAGRNPAALVTLPAVARKNAQTLTLAQLKQVMSVMRFPERAIALFALLTEMNLVEICGLQWQNVNLSSTAYLVGQDLIPAKTIAVRNQWYRGEFRPVMRNRKRFVPVPELLCSILRDIRLRKESSRPQDFVLTSRSGTPVYPGNIAKRRLKSIGRSCEMPWLSWRVFHQTHTRLKAQFGRQLHNEYEKVLPHHLW
jgi:integrase